MFNFLIWVATFSAFKKSQAQECDQNKLNNISIVCDFSVNSSVESLQCESSIFLERFFRLRLYGTVKNDTKNFSENFFRTFLHSEFKSSSSFYSCKNVPIFWDIDPTLGGACSRQDICIPKVIENLDISFVNTLNLTDLRTPLKLFHNFSSLVSMSVTNSALFNLTKVNFQGSAYLKHLILKNDRLQFISDELFADLKKLEFVDLSINHLEHFPKNAFGNHLNLKYLNISYNSIKSILNDDFEGFPNLTELYLSHNELVISDGSIFNFIGALRILDIGYNNLSNLPQQLFSKLTDLKSVSCVRCQLEQIDEKLFWNSPYLFRIDFSENHIDDLPSDLFRNQPSLEYINFRDNKISCLRSFRNKTRLKALLFSENKLTSLNDDIFTEAPNLRWINISHNKLTVITDKHVQSLKDVTFLDLSHNNIVVVELGKTTKIKIRFLVLSNNLIKKFEVNWRNFVFLEGLDVNNNYLEFIDVPPCIPTVKQTVTFSFKYNKITSVGLKSLLQDEDRAQTDRNMMGCLFNGFPKNFIDLTHNPLNCDCKLYTLHRYITSNRRIKLSSFLNTNNLTCDSPISLRKELIYDLPDDVFSCPIADNCSKLCTCGIRGKDNKIFLNCTNKGLDAVPALTPPKTTILYFNKNHLYDMLSLNSYIWKNLTEIHANNNDIISLKGWVIPQNLEYLSLQGNKINQMSENFTDFITSKTNFHLYLKNNDTVCDCAKKSLKNFLINSGIKVKDVEEIVCEIDNNGTRSLLPLSKVPDLVLCPIFALETYNPKTLVILLCVIFLLLITTLVIYYKKRQIILSFLFIHCEQLFQIFCEQSDSDDEKVFDAFIAYSSSDRDLVMELLQELEEHEPHFQLCIHERDWLPGRFISDNIIHSVQSSRRTIIVLSDSFIASPWFRLELRAAVFKVSKDKMNKIIVILVDSAISLDGIDTELRHVITKKTYLVWGERWFWEKLRYAMPHKTSEHKSTHRVITKTNRRRSSEMILIKNSDNVLDSLDN